jgi:hypothetical protein
MHVQRFCGFSVGPHDGLEESFEMAKRNNRSF